MNYFCITHRSGGACPVRARTGQFAGVAPLRSALHSNRTFTTRGLYFIDRCGGVLFPVALVTIAAYKVSLRVQSERSERLRELTPAARRRSERLRELTPAARRRGLYFIDRCGGVLFPDTLIPSAGYKASLRVQSERSGGVPPLSIRGGRCASLRSALEPNIYYSRPLLFGQKRLRQ